MNMIEHCSHNKTGADNRGNFIAHFCRTGIHHFQYRRWNTVAYQPQPNRRKGSGRQHFAKESGATVDWRKFDSEPDALVYDVQIGKSRFQPVMVAASQQVPIEVFCWRQNWVTPEALVVKKPSANWKIHLKTYAGTVYLHHSTRSRWRHWNTSIKPGQAEIVNQSSAIIAARSGRYLLRLCLGTAVNARPRKICKVLTDSTMAGRANAGMSVVQKILLRNTWGRSVR